MPADRAAYARRQAALLRSLVAGADFPAGFAAEQVAGASLSLRRKRAGAVRRTWPALAHALGAEFEPRFHAFARAVAAPAAGDALADGLAFADGPAADALPDSARVELVLARARLARRRSGRDRGTYRPRRGAFWRVVLLHEPRRLLVVVRLPVAGVRQWVVGL
jgi:hypothetical protein